MGLEAKERTNLEASIGRHGFQWAIGEKMGIAQIRRRSGMSGPPIVSVHTVTIFIAGTDPSWFADLFDSEGIFLDLFPCLQLKFFMCFFG